MSPRRIAIKLFANRTLGLHELQPFIAVFHRFIQQGSVPGLLIDVADYAHVPDGPGVILIGHDVDYGIDRTGGRTGLLTTRKRAGGRDLAALFRDTLGMTLATAQALEAEAQAKLGFTGAELQIAFPDRLVTPNTAEAAESVIKVLEPVVAVLFGDGARLERDAGSASDPRRMLTLRISGGDADVATLASRLEQA
jgi:hypothetical protein